LTRLSTFWKRIRHHPVKRIIILTAGWICVGLGIVGLFLPILQGVLLIGLGLWLLSKESTLMRRLTDRLKEKFPRQHQSLLAWRSRLAALFKRGRQERL
jgi:uncharacterized membrane protein YbaN (DUF454 family)